MPWHRSLGRIFLPFGRSFGDHPHYVEIAGPLTGFFSAKSQARFARNVLDIREADDAKAAEDGVLIIALLIALAFIAPSESLAKARLRQAFPKGKQH